MIEVSELYPSKEFLRVATNPSLSIAIRTQVFKANSLTTSSLGNKTSPP